MGTPNPDNKYLRKYVRMAVLSIRNAVRLHLDSIHLFRRRSYGSALALSVLASEEIGKYFIIDFVVFHQRMPEEGSPLIVQEEMLGAMFDHSMKQGQFAANSHMSRRQAQQVYTRALEEAKQRGLYVGLPRKRGLPEKQRLVPEFRHPFANIAGRVSSPLRVGRAEAAESITAVNDWLLVAAAATSSEGSGYGLDIYEVDEVLTRRLAVDLWRRWPQSSREAKRWVRSIDPELARRERRP